MRKEIKRPYWYLTIRSFNLCSYKYWWLILLLFISYLILWYLFCFKQYSKNEFKCQGVEQFDNRLNAINRAIDSCCNGVEKAPSTTVPCNTSESMSGGTGYWETFHSLGNTSGTVVINYDMKTIPDQIDVYYNGNIIATTNDLVSGVGRISWYYNAAPGLPDFCKVVMRAPNSKTEWQYYIGCPE